MYNEKSLEIGVKYHKLSSISAIIRLEGEDSIYILTDH